MISVFGETWQFCNPHEGDNEGQEVAKGETSTELKYENSCPSCYTDFERHPPWMRSLTIHALSNKEVVVSKPMSQRRYHA
jgi:hypothetical protein